MNTLDRNEKMPDFWNVNVPPDQQTKECPDFLAYALENSKDRGILQTPDAQYERMSWTRVQDVIKADRLDLLQRVPSDLRRYRQFCHKVAQQYGSVAEFIIQERLQWTGFKASPGRFEQEDNFKILCNDWPYGIDTRITHLVVWTKFSFETEEPTANLENADGQQSSADRDEIETFVTRVFLSACPPDNVLWFKNWGSLKSIHAVEHFHVMLFDAQRDFVERITNGDVPLADKT